MTTHPRVLFHLLPHAPGQLPRYETDGAAGFDIRSAERFWLGPGTKLDVTTGLRVQLPPGYEMQLRPRSGLAKNCGVTVLNAPGTIDSDFRGEIIVLLVNLGEDDWQCNIGDRIAQAVIAPVCRAEIVAADALDDTARGDGGFGSTGR